MQLDSKIFIAGHRGMVGSAIFRILQSRGYSNLIVRTSSQMDLRNQVVVDLFFQLEKPDYVFLAAAKVGGIVANNTYRADFLYDNLLIEANIIHAAKKYGVKKLLFLGSSCIYPKHAAQPIREEYLLTDSLEPTNEPYAIAKIAGIKLCEAYKDQYGCNFISAMPTNLYGKGDNYHPENSHVIPGLIRRFHEAKVNESEIVTVWGTGTPRREFLFADDLADACLFLMKNYNGKSIVNIGTGVDHAIKELAEMVAETVGYKGDIAFDIARPDGTPRKWLDVSKIHNMGWQHQTGLEEGLVQAYRDFLQKHTITHNKPEPIC